MTKIIQFINPKLSPAARDFFIHRRSIVEALKEIAKLFTGTVLDVGCGQMPYREIIFSSQKVIKYVGLDLEKNDICQHKPDLTWDGKSFLFNIMLLIVRWLLKCLNIVQTLKRLLRKCEG